jgi:hypothetical protein
MDARAPEIIIRNQKSIPLFEKRIKRAEKDHMAIAKRYALKLPFADVFGLLNVTTKNRTA